ncbi:TPA: hypothetical protein SD634_003384 [Vibrio cholerae]|nr:hypothetical protein [Vibrio cholerae]
MTQQVLVNSGVWTAVSTGKTRGIIENTTGQNLKVRIEAAGGAAPDDNETWGHSLPVNKYWTWEKSSSGADIYVRTESGSGQLIVSEG